MERQLAEEKARAALAVAEAMNLRAQLQAMSAGGGGGQGPQPTPGPFPPPPLTQLPVNPATLAADPTFMRAMADLFRSQGLMGGVATPGMHAP